jgi:hypothetical protein
MARKLTRPAALENRAFLKLLRRTGNVRLACRELGLKYGTMQDRRRKHPHFAMQWDAALVFFQAWAAAGPSTTRSSADGPPPHRYAAGRRGKGEGKTLTQPSPVNGRGLYRTLGGEAVFVRLKHGRVQMRRAQAGKLTPAALQAFLSALSATCNISLAAAAVGACFNAFNRRRKKDPAFAREMRLALRQGYEALELALIEGGMPGSHEHDDWRHNDPPAMPPMSVSQALQLMYLHQKAALLVDEPTPMRRRRGESNEARNERLAQMSEARDRRAREEFEVAEVERWERGEPAPRPAGEMVRERLGLDRKGPSTSFAGPPPLEIEGRMGLPDLAQVTGWSRADPGKAAHHPERALFGGWRLEDMETRRRESKGPPQGDGPDRRKVDPGSSPG